MTKINHLKYLVIAALPLLAACTNVTGEPSASSISDRIEIAPAMAATPSRNYQNYTGKIQVYSYENANRGTQYFWDKATSTDGVYSWDNNIHLWPKDKSLDFIAIGNVASVDANKCYLSNGAFTEFGYDNNDVIKMYYINYYQGDPNTGNVHNDRFYDDLVVATKYNQTKSNGTVDLKMLHALAGIRIKIKNNTEHLDLRVFHIEITNVVWNACYYPPTQDSEYREGCWDQVPENERVSAHNPYRTGTWKWHNLDRMGSCWIRNSYDFAANKENYIRHGEEQIFNGNIDDIEKKPPYTDNYTCYLIPHFPYGATTYNNTPKPASKIRFYMHVYDSQTGQRHDDAFGADGWRNYTDQYPDEGWTVVKECDFMPSADWSFGVGRLYTITYTFNGKGEINIQANVSPFVNEDWGISAN